MTKSRVDKIDPTMFLNSCLGGAWAWRVPHLGRRNYILSVERRRPVVRPDAGEGRGLGLQRPNWPDDVFQFLSAHIFKSWRRKKMAF